MREDAAPGALERPLQSGANAAAFGSDVVAEILRALALPYIALNPGASYRGLHDSLVNFLGNETPQILLCLHEEAAIAIAHGYAKVTGRAMAVAVHSNVGLFHATMAMFNAWCDRMPIIVLGATGPVDAPKRRPWIDWIHTARDQASVVRGFVKWDDQPASPAAAREAVMRGAWLANTAPKAPVYIVLDAEMQEAKLAEPLPPLDTERFVPPISTAPSPEHVKQASALLHGAKRPIILAGRVSRDIGAWNSRVALAESLNARVVTDIKVGAAFPTDHPLHVGAPAFLAPTPDALEAINAADVILSLDWVDLAGTLRLAKAPAPGAIVIQVSLDHHLHNGWSMDYQGLPPVDLFIATDPDIAAREFCGVLGANVKPVNHQTAIKSFARLPDGALTVEHLAHALREAAGSRAVSLMHLPLSWNGSWWPFHHPLDYLGSDGGGGVGGGPGISVGAALALKGSGRLPISICGDGDFLMGATAIWTAAHYRIPLLLVVANNRSFYNDEVHQERVARMRGRPVENKWIGQRISDPDIDLAALARAQGAKSFGPVDKATDLAGIFANAIAAVDNGAVAVVDVRVEPGYGAAMAAAVARKSE
ncbi:MAG: thiamine pyrophosphate-binding protein [Rhizobiales bacterium]|nr:thiamine pyrophosphate-binding protein [Hyphomicrobiales bacterium]